MPMNDVRLWLVGVALLHASAAAAQQGADSTRVSPVRATASSFLFSPFDSIGGSEFSLRHSLSLDHFLEFVPGYFLVRLGPIGAATGFSRYGAGGGRAAVYIGNVLLNDPQDDRAPLAIIPTTAVGGLVHGTSSSLPTHSDIEGILRIIEPAPASDNPATVIDVATGDRGLKQRRVRFSSVTGKMGVDLSYDELRNDGYSFDSRGLVTGRDFGRSTSRTQSLNLRGTLPGGEEYLFAFRRFTSTFQGDLIALANEQRRHGDYGLLQSNVRGVGLTVYSRGYEVTTRDSVTSNRTSAVAVNIPVMGGSDRELVLGLNYEDILSTQDVAGGRSDDRLEKGAIGVSGKLRVGSGMGVRYGVNVAHQFNLSSDWGGHLGLARAIGQDHGVTVEVKRSFRLPNLGELFLPAHTTAGTVITGNRQLDGETGLEFHGRLFTRVGVVENEIRAGVLRVDDAILPTGSSVVTLRNASSRSLRFIEDRVRARGSWRGVQILATGSAEYASGDKSGFFELVPDYRLNASLQVGRSIFKNTSNLFVTADYQYNDSRSLIGGGKLGSFGVLNLKADARLIDAQLYVLWLNALDKQYQTVSSFLMTPSTVMFGVSWTFVN